MAFYVTTPIYYVNAAPHLGHAYTTIGADILARHMRQRGEEVFFLTGTDEHGEPVAQAAERAGVTPKELADTNAARFQDLMPRINASIDYFIRTSDPRHGKRVQEVMQRIYDNGDIELGTYEGLYCVSCEAYYAEEELVDGGDVLRIDHSLDGLHRHGILRHFLNALSLGLGSALEHSLNAGTVHCPV